MPHSSYPTAGLLTKNFTHQASSHSSILKIRTRRVADGAKPQARISGLWRRLRDLEGKVPPEPVRPAGRSRTWEEIRELEARVAHHNQELLASGWTPAEIATAYPEPDPEEKLYKLMDEIRRAQAEREAENG